MSSTTDQRSSLLEAWVGALEPHPISLPFTHLLPTRWPLEPSSQARELDEHPMGHWTISLEPLKQQAYSFPASSDESFSTESLQTPFTPLSG